MLEIQAFAVILQASVLLYMGDMSLLVALHWKLVTLLKVDTGAFCGTIV